MLLFLSMKFAHLADCHVGGWQEPRLRQLGIESFRLAIDTCLQENVGLVLIAGDLFNTALPSIELVKEVAHELSKLKEENVGVYIIPGSHDFSPSGKTMLDVLERAGLCVNVFKVKDNQLQITEDKTGVKITGVLGLAAGLDKEVYKKLDFSNVENAQGFKIFMLHTTVDEFKPDEHIEGESINSFPKSFNYYAAGHVHYLLDKKIHNGLLVYPGPVFPNNFKELEDLKHGRFCIVDDDLNLRRIDLKIKDVVSYTFDVTDKNPEEVTREILSTIKEFYDKIVLLRLGGVLQQGKPGDIDFKSIFDALKTSYCILKNTNQVSSKEFQEFEIEEGEVVDVEDKIIEEHIGQIRVEFNEKEIVKNLMNVLDDEKLEGEKGYDFEDRLEKNVVKILHLEEIWSCS